MPLNPLYMKKVETNIYTLLDHLKIRKAMYLGNHYNFHSLDAFVSGFTMAASDRQLELNSCPNFGYFSTWLLGHLDKHYGLSGGWHWQITNRTKNDDQKSFDEFFYFLDIFKSSKAYSKSIIIDKSAIEFSKSGSVKRFEIIDGKEIPLDKTPFKIVWTTIDNSTTVWLDYLDKFENFLLGGIWSINSTEAANKLTAEFGNFTSVWTEYS